MKKLSEKQKIARATKIQNEAYSLGVKMATDKLNAKPCEHSWIQDALIKVCFKCGFKPTPPVNESWRDKYHKILNDNSNRPLFNDLERFIERQLSTARQEADKQYSKKVYISISMEIIKTLELIKKSKEEKIEFPYVDYLNRIETLKDIQKILDSLTSKGGV